MLHKVVQHIGGHKGRQRRAKADVLDAEIEPDLIWLLAAFFKKRGVKYVYDHHDLCPELILAKKNTDAPEKLAFPFRLLYRLMLYLERKAVRQQASWL